VVEQQRGDAAAVHVIDDGEGDLGHAWLAGRLVAGNPDELGAEPGEQRAVLTVRRPADAAGLAVGRGRADAEKAQVDVVRRHLSVHLPDRLLVLRPGRRDQDRGAVGEQRVDAVRRGVRRGLGLCGHRAASISCR
jgi:hypothetical protein